MQLFSCLFPMAKKVAPLRPVNTAAAVTRADVFKGSINDLMNAGEKLLQVRRVEIASQPIIDGQGFIDLCRCIAGSASIKELSLVESKVFPVHCSFLVSDQSPIILNKLELAVNHFTEEQMVKVLVEAKQNKFLKELHLIAPPYDMTNTERSKQIYWSAAELEAVADLVSANKTLKLLHFTARALPTNHTIYQQYFDILAAPYEKAKDPGLADLYMEARGRRFVFSDFVVNGFTSENGLHYSPTLKPEVESLFHEARLEYRNRL